MVSPLPFIEKAMAHPVWVEVLQMAGVGMVATIKPTHSKDTPDGTKAVMAVMVPDTWDMLESSSMVMLNTTTTTSQVRTGFTEPHIPPQPILFMFDNAWFSFETLAQNRYKSSKHRGDVSCQKETIYKVF